MFPARWITLSAVLIYALSHAATVVRGPYLQSGSSTGMTIRWQTDVPTESVLRYGSNALTNIVVALEHTSEHEVRAEGLSPDTSYSYSIGTRDTTLASGTDYTFQTAPTNARPVRVWVIGDSGTADTNAAAVRDSYAGFTRGVRTDVWLMLGDNAYPSGTDAEYQVAVFNMYAAMLRQVPLWPALGNHDSGPNDPLNPPPFIDIFTLPQNGECGGVPSGSERFYSFDYANIHLVCLDSHSSPRAATGAMAAWLKSDLAATDKDWIIAYWHHPPYSWGEHDSDWEYPLIEMRENIVPVLEEYGVDLVLCGHSHSYERSFFLDGHYDPSWDLEPTSILAASGIFQKAWGGLGARGGAVYVVCGNSGAGQSEAFRLHPAMAVNAIGYGSVVLDFNGLRLTAKYLRHDSVVVDTFTIDKSMPTTIRPFLNVSRGTSATAVMTWPTSNPFYTLEGSTNIASADWQSIPAMAAIRGRSNVLVIPTVGGEQFFRLRQAP